jgi:hypothetical protein
MVTCSEARFLVTTTRGGYKGFVRDLSRVSHGAGSARRSATETGRRRCDQDRPHARLAVNRVIGFVRFRCPLIEHAERYGTQVGSVTDIYLLKGFAHNMPASTRRCSSS